MNIFAASPSRLHLKTKSNVEILHCLIFLFRSSFSVFFSACVFEIGLACVFEIGLACVFETGRSCVFETGRSCVFEIGLSLVFDGLFGDFVFSLSLVTSFLFKIF